MANETSIFELPLVSALHFSDFVLPGVNCGNVWKTQQMLILSSNEGKFRVLCNRAAITKHKRDFSVISFTFYCKLVNAIKDDNP